MTGYPILLLMTTLTGYLIEKLCDMGPEHTTVVPFLQEAGEASAGARRVADGGATKDLVSPEAPATLEVLVKMLLRAKLST